MTRFNFKIETEEFVDMGRGGLVTRVIPKMMVVDPQGAYVLHSDAEAEIQKAMAESARASIDQNIRRIVSETMDKTVDKIVERIKAR